MKIISKSEIDLKSIVVAAFNGDPFAFIDYPDDVLSKLAEHEDVRVYTAEDDDFEFECLAEQLDYTDKYPSKVYEVGYGTDRMTFACEYADDL